MGPHDPCHVANYFIEMGVQDNMPITPMKTQKLIFFAHGWMLGIHGRPLLDTGFESWRYGPVMPVVYHRLAYHGGDTIPQPILALPKDFDDDELEIMTQVYELYAPFDDISLSGMTAAKDGPWHRTWKKNPP